MTLGKRIALFAASAAVIGAGTLTATMKSASAAPLLASPYVVADHNGNRDWQNQDWNRGHDLSGNGGFYVQDDTGYYHGNDRRDRERRERERREQERREQERRDQERRDQERRDRDRYNHDR